jgi:hypothetical protein
MTTWCKKIVFYSTGWENERLTLINLIGILIGISSSIVLWQFTLSFYLAYIML